MSRRRRDPSKAFRYLPATLRSVVQSLRARGHAVTERGRDRDVFEEARREMVDRELKLTVPPTFEGRHPNVIRCAAAADRIVLADWATPD